MMILVLLLLLVRSTRTCIAQNTHTHTHTTHGGSDDGWRIETPLRVFASTRAKKVDPIVIHCYTIASHPNAIVLFVVLARAITSTHTFTRSVRE